jgi:hypothetical protein
LVFGAERVEKPGCAVETHPVEAVEIRTQTSNRTAWIGRVVLK